MKDNQSRGFWTGVWAEEGGATAIEYALIASFVVLAIIGALGLVGDQLILVFEEIITAL